MFSKGSGKGFFKRASSWKDKNSKQKSENSGSAPEQSRLHKATSLNDVFFQASRRLRARDEASAIEASFSRIQLDDIATASPRTFLDSSDRYQPGPSRRKSGKKSTGRSIPRPTFKGDDSQINNLSQDRPRAGPYRSIRSPVKRSISSKDCVDCPATQNIHFDRFGDGSPGGGSMNLNPVSGGFSTGNAPLSSRRQSDSPKLRCHRPLQTPPTNQLSNTPDRQSPVFGRHSTGGVARTPPQACVSCQGPLETTPPDRQFGGAKGRPIRGRGASRSPQTPPEGTSAVQQRTTPTKRLGHPSETGRSNPDEDRQFSTENVAGSSLNRRGAQDSTSADSDPVKSFDDFDALREARSVLASVLRDVNQSLDAISSNTAFPGVVRRGNSGWGTASNEPLGVGAFAVDSLPTSYETQLKIVEACQTRCLEYREMIKFIAESVLEEVNRSDSSTFEFLASLYQDFVQLKGNCSQFKQMVARGSWEGRADENLSNEMALFVQGLCLNTMQMQNEVFLERLQNGFSLIRAQRKLVRFMNAYFNLNTEVHV